MLIKFRVRGGLRFLSHAETVKIFQRACVRAGIEVQYSEGYNPRLKLSLPLPRSVGVESDDELLCIKVAKRTGDISELCGLIKSSLGKELPAGIELAGVEAAKGKISFTAASARYILTVREEYAGEELKAKIEKLLASESFIIERHYEPGSSKFKRVDAKEFIKSVTIQGGSVSVECKISSAGAIRIEEILKVLALEAWQLAEPVRRTNVVWQEN
jgi:radical SAM-linked protein